MKKLIVILNIFVLLSFLACSDIGSSSSDTTGSSKPEIRDFLANIDTGTSAAQTLGEVEVISAGSSPISSYRLEGNGYSNFDISSSGEISTRSDTNLDCTTYKKYDLNVIATNKYGDSNKAEALIQINCLDEPVLQPYRLSIVYGSSGTMVFTRTDVNSTDTANIQEIQLVDAPSGVSVDTNGAINVDEYLPLPRYDIKVRARNTSGKTGPYVYLTIFTGNDGSGDSGGGEGSDDFPDYIEPSTYTAAYIGSGGGYYDVYGFMNFYGDHDYIKIYIEADNTEVYFDLYTDGNYNYGDGGDYMALYDEYGTYYNTYSSHYEPVTLNAGYYYVNVHETSDSYTLGINANIVASTVDNIGDDIASASYIGTVNSSYDLYQDSNIDTYGDRDVYVFDVSEPGNFSIGTSYAGINTYGRLYDINGSLLNENDDGVDSNFYINQSLGVGTYYIEVSHNIDNDIGNYGLYVEYVGP